MAIRRIELRDFTVFGSASIELCPGLNALVGENATGKTHVLKALHALVRAFSEEDDAQPSTVDAWFRRVFLPSGGDLARLAHRPSHGRVVPRVHVEDAHGYAEWTFVPKERRLTYGARTSAFGQHRSVFVPSHAALALLDGFALLEEIHELALDATYFDLAVDLARTDEHPLEAFVEVAADLEAITGYGDFGDGRLERRSPDGTTVEPALASEGIRKLAGFVRLLRDGAIGPGTLLLWDEPDANLSPRYASALARALVGIANHGVQVVLATHDATFVRALASAASAEGCDARAVAFAREDDGVRVHAPEALDGASSLASPPWSEPDARLT